MSKSNPKPMSGHFPIGILKNSNDTAKLSSRYSHSYPNHASNFNSPKKSKHTFKKVDGAIEEVQDVQGGASTGHHLNHVETLSDLDFTPKVSSPSSWR